MLICREAEKNVVLRASVCLQNKLITEIKKASLMLIFTKAQQCFLMLLPNYTCACKGTQRRRLLKVLSHLTPKVLRHETLSCIYFLLGAQIPSQSLLKLSEDLDSSKVMDCTAT